MMNDQATTLRQMAMSESSARMPIFTEKASAKQRNIAITGGKGGVGKSTFSLNVALELGLMRNRVALIDADFGLANLDLLCGVTPKFHFGHFITKEKALSEIAIELADGVTLLPGGSGIEELANFSPSSQPHVFDEMGKIEKNLDFMLIDTAAGIAENVSGVLAAASEAIIVVTPEPTSIVDAYATIKLMLRRSPDKKISVVINNTVGLSDAQQVFQSINGAVRGFLNKQIEFLGMIPRDTRVQEAIREQIPVVKFAPDTPASRAIRLIAKELNGQGSAGIGGAQIQFFWDLLSRN